LGKFESLISLDFSWEYPVNNELISNDW
jgi:hypothetical protein